MIKLGFAYLDGTGVKKNQKTAEHWFTRAAMAGDPDAMLQLGIFFENGEGGFPQNLTQGYAWLRLAAERYPIGHPRKETSIQLFRWANRSYDAFARQRYFELDQKLPKPQPIRATESIEGR
jgi:TPR repeat protein